MQLAVSILEIGVPLYHTPQGFAEPRENSYGYRTSYFVQNLAYSDADSQILGCVRPI